MANLNRQKNETSFEINLLPFISLLAVCISFLLLTTVWIHIGTLDIRQAIGEASEEKPENPPSVWVLIEDDGRVELEFKDLPEGVNLSKVSLSPRNRKIDWEGFTHSTLTLKELAPELKTALVMPAANTAYEDLIKILDQFRKVEISDIGVTPL